MKKSSLCIISLLAVLNLTSCGLVKTSFSKMPDSVKINNLTKNATCSSITTKQSIEVENESSKKDTNCRFTTKKQSMIKSYFKKYPFIYISQTLETGRRDKNATTSRIYDVEVDLANKVTDFRIKDEKGTDGVHYIRDYKTGGTYKQSGGKWEACQGVVRVIDWDISDLENAYDVWEYLLGDNNIYIGARGYISGDYEYYHKKTKASKNSVSGIKYDKLGDSEVTYIFREINNTFEPVSVVKNIDYIYKGKKYFIRSIIRIGYLGNTKLEVPDVKAGDVVYRKIRKDPVAATSGDAVSSEEKE